MSVNINPFIIENYIYSFTLASKCSFITFLL